MARSTRPSGKLELIRKGEMTVDVARPFTGLPEGLHSYFSSSRQHWINPSHLAQPVRVSYQLFRNPVQLADLAERSARNKSGRAVRGWAEAVGGRIATEGLTEQRIASLVRSAANLASRKCIEGPAVARVKLLEQPEPYEPACAKCKRPFGEHFHEVRQGKGMWVGGRTRGAHHDPEAPRTDHYYWCESAASALARFRAGEIHFMSQTEQERLEEQARAEGAEVPA